MNGSPSSNVTVKSHEKQDVTNHVTFRNIIEPLLSSIQKVALVFFEKSNKSFSQSVILSKDAICLARCIAAFSVSAFIKLEYDAGNNFEMKKYVPLQAVPSKKNVIIKILIDIRFLIHFINSISHSPNCFYIVII